MNTCMWAGICSSNASSAGLSAFKTVRKPWYGGYEHGFCKNKNESLRNAPSSCSSSTGETRRAWYAARRIGPCKITRKGTIPSPCTRAPSAPIWYSPRSTYSALSKICNLIFFNRGTDPSIFSLGTYHLPSSSGSNSGRSFTAALHTTSPVAKWGRSAEICRSVPMDNTSTQSTTRIPKSLRRGHVKILIVFCSTRAAGL
jgi:hypothetical protein